MSMRTLISTDTSLVPQITDMIITGIRMKDIRITDMAITDTRIMDRRTMTIRTTHTIPIPMMITNVLMMDTPMSTRNIMNTRKNQRHMIMVMAMVMLTRRRRKFQRGKNERWKKERMRTRHLSGEVGEPKVRWMLPSRQAKVFDTGSYLA
mmetsp:Transcript_2413/g.5965  ORF Transcript_2413/g.5965 Transcript_2413/m.5965 type:complete len:150 (-) Transcript_2413:123-572(-)